MMADQFSSRGSTTMNLEEVNAYQMVPAKATLGAEQQYDEALAVPDYGREQWPCAQTASLAAAWHRVLPRIILPLPSKLIVTIQSGVRFLNFEQRRPQP